MKHFILIIILIVLVSFANDVSDAERFHVKIVGKEQVREFKKKHPNIVANRDVYVAYLSKYYNGNEDEYVKLLKK